MDYDNIKLKRVYDTREDSDGRRLLADRLWPRGIKKSDLHYDDWIKELCPSDALRKAWHKGDISYQKFESAYRQELSEQLTLLAELAQQATEQVVTLLSAVKSLEQSHLPILKKAILEQSEENERDRQRPSSSPVCYSKDN